MTFAEKLRELRNSKGMTQSELADASEQAQQTLGRWENGDQVPPFDAVQSLCQALGVPCTIFDGCEHAKIEIEKRQGRGRPVKEADAPAEPVKPVKKRKKK